MTPRAQRSTSACHTNSWYGTLMVVFANPKSRNPCCWRAEQGTVYCPLPTFLAPGNRATMAVTIVAGSWERVPPESRKTGWAVPEKILVVVFEGVVTEREVIVIQYLDS